MNTPIRTADCSPELLEMFPVGPNSYPTRTYAINAQRLTVFPVGAPIQCCVKRSGPYNVLIVYLTLSGEQCCTVHATSEPLKLESLATAIEGFINANLEHGNIWKSKLTLCWRPAEALETHKQHCRLLEHLREPIKKLRAAEALSCRGWHTYAQTRDNCKSDRDWLKDVVRDEPYRLLLESASAP